MNNNGDKKLITEKEFELLALDYLKRIQRENVNDVQVNKVKIKKANAKKANAKKANAKKANGPVSKSGRATPNDKVFKRKFYLEKVASEISESESKDESDVDTETDVDTDEDMDSDDSESESEQEDADPSEIRVTEIDSGQGKKSTKKPILKKIRSKKEDGDNVGNKNKCSVKDALGKEPTSATGSTIYRKAMRILSRIQGKEPAVNRIAGKKRPPPTNSKHYSEAKRPKMSEVNADPDKPSRAMTVKKAKTPRKRKLRANCRLSPLLSALIGVNKLPRHDVLKKMLKIIEQRNLQDPKNDNYIICDKELQKILKVKRFRIWSLMEYLKPHILN